MKYPFQITGVFRPFFLVIGATVENSYVDVEDDGIHIRYGFFRYDLRYEDIASAEPMSWPWYYGLGIRIAPGPTLGLVGTRAAARLWLKGEHAIRIVMNIRYAAIALSVADPQAFIDDVSARIGASSPQG